MKSKMASPTIALALLCAILVTTPANAGFFFLAPVIAKILASKGALTEAQRQAAAAAAREAARRQAAAVAAAAAREAARRQAAAAAARSASSEVTKKSTFVLGDSIKNASVQEAISQATRLAIGTAIKAPVSPSSSRIFVSQSQKLAPEAQKWLSLKGGIGVVAGGIATNLIWTPIANAFGLDKAPSNHIQQEFEAEIRAAIEMEESEMYLKFCVEQGGIQYGVPGKSISCLDGSEPLMSQDPLNLEKFREEIDNSG